MSLSRRDLLLAPALVAAASVMPRAARAAGGIRYGAASMIQDFRADPRYGEALKAHCDIIVPMNDLKWEQLRHDRNGFDFKDADEQIAFAQANGKGLRGHALVWYNAMPAWTETILDRREAEKELVTHIETVVTRYKDVIPSWDVANEVISHDPIEQGAFRNSIWQKRIGPSHVELAFRTAGEVAPRAELVLNDYDLEDKGPRFDARRAAILKLVRRLKDKKIPISAVGFQAHLYAERELDPDATQRFVRDLKALDVHVLVTELDVIDWRLPADIPERDRLIAAHAKTFLDAVRSEGTLKDIVTWGITDRFTWVAEVFKRDDGLPPRPLPLDAEYQKKPLFEVIGAIRGT